VDVNGSDVDCWVVSLEYEPLRSEAGASMQAAGFALSDFARSETLWVDKNRYLVYRKDSTTKMTMPNTNTPINMTQTSKVETFAVNGPLSPDVFTFTPPPGARDG
jgi:outer membrane lipoprotein-sorting protein